MSCFNKLRISNFECSYKIELTTSSIYGSSKLKGEVQYLQPKTDFSIRELQCEDAFLAAANAAWETGYLTKEPGRSCARTQMSTQDNFGYPYPDLRNTTGFQYPQEYNNRWGPIFYPGAPNDPGPDKNGNREITIFNSQLEYIMSGISSHKRPRQNGTTCICSLSGFLKVPSQIPCQFTVQIGNDEAETTEINLDSPPITFGYGFEPIEGGEYPLPGEYESTDFLIWQPVLFNSGSACCIAQNNKNIGKNHWFYAESYPIIRGNYPLMQGGSASWSGDGEFKSITVQMNVKIE